MFSKDELNYLLVCVDSRRAGNTQEVRNKAIMLMKISELLDAPVDVPDMSETQEAPADE